MAEKPEDRILNAALDVVAEKTIAGTRMHLIAERTGMVQSNVHYYYKTKNDLMQALRKKVLDGFVDKRREMLEASADSADAKLQTLLDQKRAILEETPKYDFVQTDFWLQAHIDEESRAHMADAYHMWRRDIENILIRYGKDLGEKRRSLLSFLTIAMMDGVMLQYHVDPDSLDLDEYFAMCKTMILASLDSAEE